MSAEQRSQVVSAVDYLTLSRAQPDDAVKHNSVAVNTGGVYVDTAVPPLV